MWAVFAGLDEFVEGLWIGRFVSLQNDQFAAARDDRGPAFESVIRKFSQGSLGRAQAAGFHSGLKMDRFQTGVKRGGWRRYRRYRTFAATD
jgi:hypothetical protein